MTAVKVALKDSYNIINLIFAGIILCIFIYSGIFSAEKANHPIPSASEYYGQEIAKSTGLSRSFSEIVRFNFENAKEYNPNGLRVFSFFLIQFFLRLFIVLIIIKNYCRRKPLIVMDSLIAAGLYLYCFWGVIV